MSEFEEAQHLVSQALAAYFGNREGFIVVALPHGNGTLIVTERGYLLARVQRAEIRPAA